MRSAPKRTLSAASALDGPSMSPTGAWPDRKVALFEGKVYGHLVWPPRGGRGFGYDPMFVPDGYALTFGEMEPDAKHAISHRARAFQRFARACLGEGAAG